MTKMSDSALRIKLAEADGMMKNGDKFCKKVRKHNINHCSIANDALSAEHPLATVNSAYAGPLQLEPRVLHLHQTRLPEFVIPAPCLPHYCPHASRYDRGGAEYEKAATIYKNYKQWDKAIYAYEKCAEANGKASLPTKVATALDMKAGCHRDAGQVREQTQAILRSWRISVCVGVCGVDLI